MHINEITIKNIRSISEFKMKFDKPAGWHVIIGDNGAGKSTIVRAISLGIIGPSDAKALRLNLSEWVNKEKNMDNVISLSILKHEQDAKIGQSRPRTKPFEAKLKIISRDNNSYQLSGEPQAAFDNVWSNTSGWFSCAFGPFRRFTGGEKEWLKVYYSDPRAAAHLSVFGEDVALTEAVQWLKDLHIRSLERSIPINSPLPDSDILYNPEAFIVENLKNFLNNCGLLPHNATISSISSEGVFFKDGNGVIVDVTQMSDGYRSVLSLTFELIRQLIRAYGAGPVFENIAQKDYAIHVPGIVLIDEVDAHLHPTWQARIGEWFLKVFPQIQFIVTTHSPLICRAAENGSIWRLRAPGSDRPSGEVTGIEKERLVFGDLLDAYGTELFGRNVTQSTTGQQLTEKLAQLNLKSFKQNLSDQEKDELEHLKTITSSFSNVISK